MIVESRWDPNVTLGKVIVFGSVCLIAGGAYVAWRLWKLRLAFYGAPPDGEEPMPAPENDNGGPDATAEEAKPKVKVNRRPPKSKAA